MTKEQLDTVKEGKLDMKKYPTTVEQINALSVYFAKVVGEHEKLVLKPKSLVTE